jgi:hypothetical protein
MDVVNIAAYRPVAGKRPLKQTTSTAVAMHRRINKPPFLGNASVNTTTTIEKMLKAVFSVGFAQRLHNEDPRPAIFCKACTERGLVCSAKGRNVQ